MRNKIAPIVIFLLLTALLITSCGQAPATPPSSQPATPAPAPAPKPVTLRFSTGLPPLDVRVASAKWFADEVKKRTNGIVTIDVYAGAELMDVDATPNAVIMGSVEMGQNTLPTGAYSSYVPLSSFAEVFFIWGDREKVRAQNNAYRELVDPLYVKAGVKLINFYDAGEGGIICNKPIKTADDFKGLIIRGPTQVDWDIFTALGATPARIAAAEMNDALAKGTINGVRTSQGGMVQYKLHEIAKYVLAGVTFTQFAGMMNINTWNSLPKDIQNTIMTVGKETDDYSSKLMVEQEGKTLATLKAACEISRLSSDEVKKIQKMIAPITDKIVADSEKKGMGAEAKKFLEIAAR